ncbi:Hypothetical predicted protein [Cloeon dipterum]|uniref:Uncharacterized protein n=1 Tax=Cloeon dipterum TaxID=197152 RepID=A0A8S1E4Z3_9INSE|nr:Hypothetical predicted protein [Cloeon dipterum]
MLCPHCYKKFSSGGNCFNPNCPKKSSNSSSTSHHSEGNGTGQQLVPDQVLREQILHFYQCMDTLFSEHTSAIKEIATGQSAFRPYLAGNGNAQQYSNNAQRIGTNQTEGEQNFAGVPLEALQQTLGIQLTHDEILKWKLYQQLFIQTWQMLAIGPVRNFEQVAQNQIAPVAASTANDYFTEQNTTRPLHFPNQAAECDQNPLPESEHFNNAQSIATIQTERNIQKNFAGLLVKAMQKVTGTQWTHEEALKWIFYQELLRRTMQRPMIEPVLNSTRQLQFQNLAGNDQNLLLDSSQLFGNAQTMLTYLMERNAQQDTGHSEEAVQRQAPASQPTGVSAQNVSRQGGYCVMCEMDCGNIFTHRTYWHEDKQGKPNSCYRTSIQLLEMTSERLLIPAITDLRELKKCPECKKVFFTHRCDNHGCPVPSTSSAQSNRSSTASVSPSGNEIEGFCLMCKCFFDDLTEHRHQKHLNNKNYILKLVSGQMTLLPDEKRVQNDLVK